MDWKETAGSIAKYAPMLGMALGGPLGGAIGGVVSILANAFGLTPAETTPEKINSLLATDPQAAIKLAEIEANNKVELQKLLIEQDKLRLQEKQADLADTASAREREMAVVKSTGKLDVNLYLLAWTIVVGFFVLTSLLMYNKLPQGQSEVIFMLFGGLVSGFSTVLGYFFGSSRGSQIKTQTIAAMK